MVVYAIMQAQEIVNSNSTSRCHIVDRKVIWSSINEVDDMIRKYWYHDVLWLWPQRECVYVFNLFTMAMPIRCATHRIKVHASWALHAKVA